MQSLWNFIPRMLQSSLAIAKYNWIKSTTNLKLLSTATPTSDVKFAVCDAKTFGSDTIDLTLLRQKNEHDKVTLQAQVIKISHPAKGLTKQEVTIAHRTEAALLTLWESDAGKLEIGLYYYFNRLIVCTSHRNSLAATRASVELIDDIGNLGTYVWCGGGFIWPRQWHIFTRNTGYGSQWVGTRAYNVNEEP